MLGLAQGLAFPVCLLYSTRSLWFNQTVGVTKLDKVFYHNVSKDPAETLGCMSIRKVTRGIAVSVQLNRSSKHLWWHKVDELAVCILYYYDLLLQLLYYYFIMTGKCVNRHFLVTPCTHIKLINTHTNKRNQTHNPSLWLDFSQLTRAQIQIRMFTDTQAWASLNSSLANHWLWPLTSLTGENQPYCRTYKISLAYELLLFAIS